MPTNTTTRTQAEAQEWLRAAVKDGERPQTALEAEGKAEGFTPKQLRTARKHIGVEISREGDGRSRWFLRTEAPQSSIPERARQWVADRVALGQLTAAEATAARWLIGVLADGPRRRDEVETRSYDEFVAPEPL